MNAEEHACDALITGLGGTVFSFSVSAAAQIPNVPDRRYRLKGVAFWAEIKTLKDKLSRGQLDFLKAEYACGQVVFAGDRSQLLAMVLRRTNEWRSVGYEAFAVTVARGLRRAA